MSDRYLCKAKRIDTGEWVEGCLLIDYITGQYFIHQNGDSVNESNKVGEEGCLQFLAFEVNPSTICQCTELTDKNGKRWQGDIFEASDGEFIQRYFIQWDEDKLQWHAECVTTPDFSMPLCEFEAEEIDVIGNVFDNPELLEGGAE